MFGFGQINFSGLLEITHSNSKFIILFLISQDCLCKIQVLRQLSYQNNNLKTINADYIYHKNEKGKPQKKDLPLFKIDAHLFGG